MTRLIKHSLRLVPNTFMMYLQEFLQIVISKFEEYPYSAFIYSIEFCLKEYAKYSQFNNIFQEAYDVIAHRCTTLLYKKSQFTEYPFVASDFFAFTRKFLAVNRDLFLQCKKINEVMQMLCKGIGIQHQEAAKSHSRLMIDILFLLDMEFKNNLGIKNFSTLAQVETW